MYINFKSGKYKLNAIVDLCKTESDKYIIYIPGINFEFESINWLSTSFTKNGYNFVRFNFKYHQNGNHIDNFNLNSDLQDIQCLINHLDSNGFNVKFFGIIAKSFGGTKGFLFHDKRIKVYGFIAPATFIGENFNIDHIKNMQYGKIKNIKDIILNKEILGQWRCPTIILHGTNDNVIPISNSENIYNTITGKKEIVKIMGMGHGYKIEYNVKISNTLIIFFKKYF